VTLTVARRLLFVVVLVLGQAAGAQDISARTAPSPDEDGVIGAFKSRQVGADRTASGIGMLLIQRIEVVNEYIDQNAFQSALDELLALERRPNLSPFEAAVITELKGFVYASMGKTDFAIEAYEEALEGEELPHPMHQGALYTLAHLYSSERDFDKSVELMLEWFRYEQQPFAEAYMFLGSALAALERYEQALPWMERAIEISIRPVESWYQVTYSLYVQLEQYDKAVPMLKTMLEYWSRVPQYWEALASVYQQTGEDRAAFDTTMTAYVNGMLTTPDRLLGLVEMALHHNVPFTAGSILENEMNAGIVPETEANLNLLIDSWTMAREYDRAIAAIDRVVRQADAGPHHFRAAVLQLQSGNWSGAAASAEKALAAGQENPERALVVAGTAWSELGEFDKAIAAFRKIRETGNEQERRNAERWITFVEESRSLQAANLP